MLGATGIAARRDRRPADRATLPGNDVAPAGRAEQRLRLVRPHRPSPPSQAGLDTSLEVGCSSLTTSSPSSAPPRLRHRLRGAPTQGGGTEGGSTDAQIGEITATSSPGAPERRYDIVASASSRHFLQPMAVDRAALRAGAAGRSRRADAAAQQQGRSAAPGCSIADLRRHNTSCTRPQASCARSRRGQRPSFSRRDTAAVTSTSTPTRTPRGQLSGGHAPVHRQPCASSPASPAEVRTAGSRPTSSRCNAPELNAGTYHKGTGAGMDSGVTKARRAHRTGATAPGAVRTAWYSGRVSDHASPIAGYWRRLISARSPTSVSKGGAWAGWRSSRAGCRRGGVNLILD